ncbi:MAG: hypothetical protein Kow0037_14530 [Calditrichia bacterium]
MDTILKNELIKRQNVGYRGKLLSYFKSLENKPIKYVITDTEGNWKINGIGKGNYIFLFSKENFSSEILDIIPKQSVILQKELVLSGNYHQSILIDRKKGIKVKGHTSILGDLEVNIREDTYFYFEKNSKLTLYGNIIINNFANNAYIYFQNDTYDNYSFFQIMNNESTIRLENVIFKYIKGGVYLKNIDKIKMKNCYFYKTNFEAFNINLLEIENTTFHNSENGIYIAETRNILKNNIILGNADIGVRLSNCDSSFVRKNVIKANKNLGVSVNNGGYAYKVSNVYLKYNDFRDNKRHLDIGVYANVNGEFNNFLKEKELIIFTSPYVNFDTLYFNNNFWGYLELNDIEEKIIDKKDRIGQEHQGPIINLENYSLNFINWDN